MPYRPTPRQLEYFVALAETGHFGKAARQCNVSQPTLSTQFKLLEDQLGVVLIERGTGIVKLTPTGQALLSKARRSLDMLDDFVLAANATQGQLGGRVSFGVAATAGPYFMPRLLQYLENTVPDVELAVREGQAQALHADLLDGALDCIFVPVQALDEHIDGVVVCRETVVLGVPANSRLAGLNEVTLKDLAGETLLTTGPRFRLYEEAMILSAATGSPPKENYEAGSLDGLRHMVAMGMGITVFPATYVHSEMAREEGVVVRPISDMPLARRLSVVWRRGSPRAHHFRMLAELIFQTVQAAEVPGLEPLWAEYPENQRKHPPEKGQ